MGMQDRETKRIEHTLDVLFKRAEKGAPLLAEEKAWSIESSFFMILEAIRFKIEEKQNSISLE